MPKINLLDAKVWGKIAAGEVVERPAAALKEMIENSIDAGSTMISIEIEEGGIKKMRVTDNGCGIESEDIANAFVCHATSKIASEHDLEAIGTLGFRGEALSSIAAVARVTMISKTLQSETATKLVIEAGEVISQEEVSAPVGTSIMVENLFFNMPARIKFLKKARYEEMDISATVSRLILANPNLSFKLTINNKVVYATNGRGLEDAIFEVYGKEIYSNLLPIKHTFEDLTVTGFIGNKNIAKANRTFQTLTINGRYVTNSMVSTAAQNAFENFLMKGQFPFFVLDISLPFASVDVNVHPNKMEIKFEQPNKIFSLVHHAIYDALSQADFIAKPFIAVEEPKDERPKVNTFVFPSEFLQSQTKQMQPIPVIEEVVLPKKTELVLNQPSGALDEWLVEKALKMDSTPAHVSLPSKQYEQVVTTMEQKVSMIEEEEISNHSFLPPKTESQAKMFSDHLNYKLIGVAFDTYIILQQNDRVLYIDQHAAHERELFDEIMKEINNQEVLKQDMLVPYIREVSREEIEFLEHNMDVFTSSGFEIDFFGKNTLRISSVPYILKDLNLNTFISNVFASISVIANKPFDYAINKFATMACKAAIKAGQALSENEIEALLNKLAQNEVLLCPHGRPIVVEVTKKDIEKWFKRIV